MKVNDTNYTKLDIGREIVTLTAGIGASMIVGPALRAITPYSPNPIIKVATWAGRYALVGTASGMAYRTAGREFDAVVAIVKHVKTKINDNK